jgi:hypothetical protein
VYNIKKIERDFKIYSLYPIRVYEYRREPYGWVIDPIGLVVTVMDISHYHLWEDEAEVYYRGKDSKGEEILFKGITYYWEYYWYERGEWEFASVDCEY